MNRKIVIIYNDEEYCQNVRHNIAILMSNAIASEITVYAREPVAAFNVVNEHCQCQVDVIPPEMNTQPKIRNWINAKYADFNGFVHVLSDSVEIVKDPTQFITDLETAMSVFDYHVWFSTVTDGCNFVYSKYNPRMRISCDRPECAALNLPSEINFTSHSNTQWIAYNMPRLIGSDLLRFDERFTIPMFYIIEFLARRRNTNPSGSLFFMNQYMSVASEYGTIRNCTDMKRDEIKQDLMQTEDAEFKKMNINFSPDNNIDKILELFWEKILEKTKSAV